MLTEYEKRIRTFTSATSHHGGRRIAVKDHRKHVTSGIAASASGLLAPLFLIASGKKVMSRWLEPFQENDFPCLDGSLNWLTKTDWCPTSTRICVTPNGSIDGEVIKHALGHVTKFIRKHVLPRKYRANLGGNGLEWLQYVAENNFQIVRLPENTSHFLQTCDQAINPVCQQSIRAARNEFLSNCHIGFADVAFKLKLAAAGYNAITKPVIEKSCVTAGLWPVDYRFVSALQNKEKGRGTPLDSFCSNSPRSDTFGLQQLHQMKRRGQRDGFSDAFGRFVTNLFTVESTF